MIVRKDLSYPQKCVQACHATLEVARNFITAEEKHPSVIVCEIRDEFKLQCLMQKLDCKEICYKAFREPDIGNQITAIATAPLNNGERKLFAKFQLLKEA